MTDEHPIQRRRAGRPWDNKHTWYEKTPGKTTCLRCHLDSSDGRAADPCEPISLIEREDRDRPEQMAAARRWLRERCCSCGCDEGESVNALVTADPEARAVYVKLRQGEAARTHFVESLVGVDLDAEGMVLGIELLHTIPLEQWAVAWKNVPPPKEEQ